MKKKELQDLLDRALEICLEYDKVSPYLFQRTMSIDLKKGMKIFYELQAIGVIDISTVVFEPDNVIGEINEEVLKRYFQN